MTNGPNDGGQSAIVLDASVLIAVLSQRDVHHERALAILESHARERFLAPALTLAEALVGPASRDQGAEALEALERMGVETAPESAPLPLAGLRAETRLRMPDVVVLLLARRIRSPLATFDARLRVVAGALGVPTL